MFKSRITASRNLVVVESTKVTNSRVLDKYLYQLRWVRVGENEFLFHTKVLRYLPTLLVCSLVLGYKVSYQVAVKPDLSKLTKIILQIIHF